MTEDDAKLAEDCKRGDLNAFATLVERHQKAVFNVAFRFLDSVEDARDVTQTSFLKALENIKSYKPRYKFHSWIYRIAINESIDQLNQRKRQRPLVGEQADATSGPDRRLGSRQVSRAVQNGLNQLSADYRAVIVLKHFLDRSYEEVSEILGIPAKTVKSRLYTARQQLRELLKDEDML